MATIPIMPESARWRPLAIWRWVAPFAAFGLLLFVGAGIALTYQAQQDYRHILSSSVLERWAVGGAGPLSQAALLLALWILWRIARKAALYGTFVFVEAGLPGPPMDKRVFRFALATQLVLALLYAVGATVLMIASPIRATPAPLINLGQAEVETLIGPLAPLAIALAALLAYDFIGYWLHRAQHRFAFLWRFHAVHHSVENMDSLNSYAHPVDLVAQNAVLTIVGLGIGFTFDTMLWFLAFQAIHDRLLHTRAPINFGILGALLIDNRAHFLHHTRTEARSGNNFAATFTIFDRLFGTYQRPPAGPLVATGLEEQPPPATIMELLLAKAAGPQPAAETGGSAVSPAMPAGGCRPSA